MSLALQIIINSILEGLNFIVVTITYIGGMLLFIKNIFIHVFGTYTWYQIPFISIVPTALTIITIKYLLRSGK